MDAAKMKEILKTEYGICDEAEFNAAVSKSAGINHAANRKECQM